MTLALALSLRSNHARSGSETLLKNNFIVFLIIDFMKRIYFDYAATTPVDPAVFATMKPYFSEKFGNPSSLHFFGQEAMAAIDESREKIAKNIGANFREIIFTGSATEANNLALRGAIKEFKIKNLGFRDAPHSKSHIPNPRVIVSAIEHESILETCRDLESEGVEIIYLPANREGAVDLKKLKEALNERTILVSTMYANNEIGTIQPIVEISKIIQEFKEKKFSSPKPAQASGHGVPSKVRDERAEEQASSPRWGERSGLREEGFSSAYPLFHTDAVQAFQYLDCDVNKLGVDLMTLSAHKIYGPKGVGVLYARALSPKPYPLNPIITGGGQEFGFRSGTENVAAIVGFAKAIELVSNSRELENKRIKKISDYFWKELKKINSKIQLNSIPKITDYKLPITNLPNILNIYFPESAGWRTAKDLLIKLDLAGVAVSSGSACSTRSSKPSHVLKSCGLSENRIKSSLRFSLGRFTAKAEINEAIKRLKKIIGPVV